MLELHPCLDPKCNQVSYPLKFIMLNFGNQHFLVDFPYHTFNDIFETSTINEEQMTPHTSRFTLEVEIHFFVKVFFIATTRVVTLQLSLHAFTMHIQCFNYL